MTIAGRDGIVRACTALAKPFLPFRCMVPQGLPPDFRTICAGIFQIMADKQLYMLNNIPRHGDLGDRAEVAPRTAVYFA